MYYVLYNPNSAHRFKRTLINKLIRKLERKSKEKCKRINLFKIEDEKVFISEKNELDNVIICGGDGTIDTFLNRINGATFTCRLYLYRCGSGNDLAREYKGRLFEITNLAHDLPHVLVNGVEDYVFTNGIGCGVDALVCYKKALNKQEKKKKSYFKIAKESFGGFRPYSLDIKADGKELHYDKVWFFVCNHGKYFGGGMKVTPKAKRDDDVLDFLVVEGLSRAKLVLIFPLVFFGWHLAFKKHVHYIQGKEFEFKLNGCKLMQRDGEVLDYVETLKVTR